MWRRSGRPATSEDALLQPGADALHAAIKDYWLKTGRIKLQESETHDAEAGGEEGEELHAAAGRRACGIPSN